MSQQLSQTLSIGEDPCRVLVIEDNTPDVLLIMEALKEQALTCDYTHLHDGDEAIAALGKGNGGTDCYDLLILDLNMPRVGGLEVLSQFKAIPACQDTPILVLTSSLSPDERARAESLGADRYVRKPADLYEFLSSVGTAAKELLSRERVRT